MNIPSSYPVIQRQSRFGAQFYFTKSGCLHTLNSDIYSINRIYFKNNNIVEDKKVNDDEDEKVNWGESGRQQILQTREGSWGWWVGRHLTSVRGSLSLSLRHSFLTASYSCHAGLETNKNTKIKHSYSQTEKSCQQHRADHFTGQNEGKKIKEGENVISSGVFRKSTPKKVKKKNLLPGICLLGRLPKLYSGDEAPSQETPWYLAIFAHNLFFSFFFYFQNFIILNFINFLPKTPLTSS